MKRLLLHSWRREFAATVLVVPAMIVSLHHAHGFTPESPEVKSLVAKAVAFLESEDGGDSRMGAQALVGLALYKNQSHSNHPRIVQAVETIQQTLKRHDVEKLNLGSDEIYQAGLAVIFLITLDPETYAPEIESLLKYLQLRQKPHGGWGYSDRKNGDTSMTQYGVLSAWEASEAGFQVPIDSIESVASWLLKSQDPSGGYVYQAKASASFTPIPQEGQPTLSMTAAGLGSLYICADLLGVTTRVNRPDDALPAALKEVKQETPKTNATSKTQLPAALFQTGQSRAVAWMQKNYKIDPGLYTHYYLYALERYMSFRELSEKSSKGQRPKDGPNWYNDGVAFLTETQAENGSWRSECGTVPDTSFAVLFLLRSTKKSIERRGRKFGDGILVGGRGLPKESDGAMVRNGAVVAKPLLGPAEQLLAVLEGSENSGEIPDYDQAIDLLTELPSQEAAELVDRHAEQLRRLAGDWSVEARLAAVRALAKTRDLDNVPTLIYALTDPNLEVVRSASRALRRLSRRPSGYGLPDEPTEDERLEAIRNWKAWYLAVRPDAEFRPIEFGE